MDGPAPSSEGKTSVGSPQDKGGKAPRAAFSSAHLYSAAPRPVSYTHLDVYKRQPKGEDIGFGQIQLDRFAGEQIRLF